MPWKDGECGFPKRTQVCAEICEAVIREFRVMIAIALLVLSNSSIAYSIDVDCLPDCSGTAVFNCEIPSPASSFVLNYLIAAAIVSLTQLVLFLTVKRLSSFVELDSSRLSITEPSRLPPPCECESAFAPSSSFMRNFRQLSMVAPRFWSDLLVCFPILKREPSPGELFRAQMVKVLQLLSGLSADVRVLGSSASCFRST